MNKEKLLTLQILAYAKPRTHFEHVSFPEGSEPVAGRRRSFMIHDGSGAKEFEVEVKSSSFILSYINYTRVLKVKINPLAK